MCLHLSSALSGNNPSSSQIPFGSHHPITTEYRLKENNWIIVNKIIVNLTDADPQSDQHPKEKDY